MKSQFLERKTYVLKASGEVANGFFVAVFALQSLKLQNKNKFVSLTVLRN